MNSLVLFDNRQFVCFCFTPISESKKFHADKMKFIGGFLENNFHFILCLKNLSLTKLLLNMTLFIFIPIFLTSCHDDIPNIKITQICFLPLCCEQGKYPSSRTSCPAQSSFHVDWVENCRWANEITASFQS